MDLDIVKKPKKANHGQWEEDRYIIVEKETGKVIDDAQGYGYKSFQSAKKAMWYRFDGGEKKINAAKSEATKFWKDHPKVRSLVEDFYDCNVKQICLGEVSEEDLIKEVKEKFNIKLDKKYLNYV